MNKLNLISSNAAILSIATIVASVFGVIRQIYIATSLTPLEFGMYNFLFILLAYANFADFGINNGALLESSRAKGAGDITVMKIMVENGFSATVFLGTILSITIFCVSFISIDIIQEVKIVLRLFSLVIISTMILNYYQIELRINEKFPLLSSAIILSPICSLIVTLLIGEVYEKNNAEWMLLGWISGPFIVVIFLVFYTNLKLKLSLDFNIVYKFIKIGIPLTLMSLTLATFFGIDRWVLINIAEPKLLGFYALGCTFGTALYMIPNALGTVLLSNFLQGSGSKNTTVKTQESLSILTTTLMGSSYIMSIILGVMLVCLPFVLNYIFPDYIDGLEIIALVILAYVIISFIPPLTNYLIAYDEKLKLFGIFFFGLLLSGISIFLGYKNFGILGSGYSLLVVFLLIEFLVLFLVETKNNTNERWNLTRLFNLFFPYMVTLTLVFFINPYIKIISIYDDILLLTKLVLIFLLISCCVLTIHAYISGFFYRLKTQE